MKLKKLSLIVACLLIGFVSCKKDDDDNDIVEIEERDRAEQQVADMDSLTEYLNTHYYNAAELAEIGLDAGIQDIIVSNTKVGDGYVLLNGAVEKRSLTYEDVFYEYFVLEISKGGGTESPTFADTAQILYEGFLIDDSVFDFKYHPDAYPLDLTNVIAGWRKVIPTFNIAESFVVNNDGTVGYNNGGLGIMFLPSGLAYFSQYNTGIPSYSPLIFKFELVQFVENDHDNDGVPSHLEDLNGNGELLSADFTTADDDTDEDGVPNYLDTDDDGDGVPTIDEDIDGDGDPTNDIGKNGIAKYLDPEETESK